MFKYEPIIDPNNEAYVHHIVIYACPTASDNDVGKSFSCYKTRPDNLNCIDVIIAWAVGGVVSFHVEEK